MASLQPDKKVHSIKVPRLYKVAAGVLKDFKNGSFTIQIQYLIREDLRLYRDPRFNLLTNLLKERLLNRDKFKLIVLPKCFV